MKKFLFYHLLLSVCYLLFFAAPTFAHQFGPVPPGGCPVNHVESAGSCFPSNGLCSDQGDAAMSDPVSNFALLSSQLDTQHTCIDPDLPGGVSDSCDTSSSISLLTELYCVNSDHRCHQTTYSCPLGQTCNGGKCEPLSSSTCRDSDPTTLLTPAPDGNLNPFGNQIYSQGNCSAALTGGTVYDSCRPTGELNETYCVVGDNNYCWQTYGPCPSGYTCSSGACVSSGGGGTCTSNAQCRTDQICGAGGTCVSCSSPTSNFSVCTTDSQCGTGNRCGVSNSCYTCSGGSCSTNAQCGSNQICSNGTCVPSGGGTYPAPTSGGGGVGTITAPGFNLPSIPSGQTDVFVAGLVRNGIGAMILIAFVVALIWLILAGFKFILANGEPKEVSAAWSQIRYALIGMAVIMSAYAIIKLVETFFQVNIIGGGLRLPTRSS